MPHDMIPVSETRYEWMQIKRFCDEFDEGIRGFNVSTGMLFLKLLIYVMLQTFFLFMHLGNSLL